MAITAAEAIAILSTVPGDSVIEAETSGGEFMSVKAITTISFEYIDGTFGVTIELG